MSCEGFWFEAYIVGVHHKYAAIVSISVAGITIGQ
jgi:hypothetical protein